MFYFEDVIEEIEKNITSDIDIDALSKKMNMSVYEFRRIFTFVTKIPLGEYIRKRRLSLAAVDMYGSDKSITHFAEKYGYDSPSSFTRAFKEFHSVSPAEVLNGNTNFKLLTKINARLIVSGCTDISYSIIEEAPYTVSGVESESHISDSECCEDSWNAFYDREVASEIEKSGEPIYAVYKSEKDFVRCLIGVRGGLYQDKFEIPGSLWACFKIRGASDDVVNEFYNNILSQYLASGGVERNYDLPNVEIFPADMSEDDFEWEIRIPVKRSSRDG